MFNKNKVCVGYFKREFTKKNYFKRYYKIGLYYKMMDSCR